MRRSRCLILLAGFLALPIAVSAKGKPTPMPCPDDVAASLAETCPCEGKMQPDGSTAPYKNHGQYVSCVVRFRNQLRKSDCPKDTLHTVARCAARSTCGCASFGSAHSWIGYVKSLKVLSSVNGVTRLAASVTV